MEQIFKGTVVGDKTGTPARQAADVINGNFALVDSRITALENPDAVLKKGNIDTDGLNVHVDELAFEWRISQMEFTENPEYNVTLDAATDGYHRKDVLLGNNTGGYNIFKGNEDATSATEPNLFPVGTIKLGVIDVYGATITGSTPVDLSAYATKDYVDEGLSTKLDASAYNDRFKGKYTSLGALETAYPTANAGDYAQVDSGSGSDVINYNYDIEDGWIEGGSGSSATNTDALPEGSIHLYFEAARVLATVLSGISFATGGAIVSTDTVLQAFGKIQKQINDILTTLNGKLTANLPITGATKTKVTYDANGLVTGGADATTADIADSTDKRYVTDTQLTKVNAIDQAVSATEKATWNAGDMTTNTAQTVSGLKTFLNGMLGLRNSANTFTNLFSVITTATRTWTWPDKSGTIAMTSDIVAQLNGTVNKLVKFGTTTTGTDSRITDTGTYLGIDVINTPLKDITLGNQSTKSVGIEDSESIFPGRDLIVTAGRTVNFIISSILTVLDATNRNYLGSFPGLNGDVFFCTQTGLFKQTGGTGALALYATTGLSGAYITGGCVTPSGDVYVCTQLGTSPGINKQTGGTGSFSLQLAIPAVRSMCCTPNGDVYFSNGSTNSTGGSIGDIYRRTGGVGSFVALGVTARDYHIAAAPNNDVYAAVRGGSIYRIASGTNTLTDLLTTLRTWSSISVSPNGDIYAAVYNGDIYKSSVGSAFLATGQTTRTYEALSVNINYTLYAGGSGNAFFMNTFSAGFPNLDGGTYKAKAGTGKGTGKSRYEFYTGQKTVSGTDMQLDTLRAYFDENGFFVYLTPPVYANDAAADADVNLPSGAYYKVTGSRVLYQKP
ncbi:hypothetical protein [Flavobacterium aquiphilum]|uniref:hypothetical protein n=1 Tax=Flavobacterium aquiphilum TaxID=3003261 RepID=UPI0024801104|nr:hypothetical protein [Flavobacterium aquiphilum]